MHHPGESRIGQVCGRADHNGNTSGVPRCKLWSLRTIAFHLLLEGCAGRPKGQWMFDAGELDSKPTLPVRACIVNVGSISTVLSSLTQHNKAPAGGKGYLT